MEAREVLSFWVRFNSVVLQPLIGDGKEMENVFWMESHATAHFLPHGDAAAPQLLFSLVPCIKGAPRHGPAALGVRQPKAQVEKGFSPTP